LIDPLQLRFRVVGYNPEAPVQAAVPAVEEAASDKSESKAVVGSHEADKTGITTTDDGIGRMPIVSVLQQENLVAYDKGGYGQDERKDDPSDELEEAIGAMKAVADLVS
jgi:hypothetical protein